MVGAEFSGLSVHPAGIAAIPALPAVRPRARRAGHLRDAVRGALPGAGKSFRGEAGGPGRCRAGRGVWVVWAAVGAFETPFSRKGAAFLWRVPVVTAFLGL